MNDTERLQQIGAYLDGAMPSEEKASFEARMREDSELEREVRILQGLREDSKAFYRKEALVEQIVRENKATIRRPLWQRPVFRVGFGLVAGIVLVLTLGVFVFRKEHLNHEAVFDQYFRAYDESGLIVERGEGAGSDWWSAAGDAYRSEEYDTAARFFYRIVQEDSANIPARFYLANSLLAGDKTPQAIPHLQYVVSRKDFLYERQAMWLLALSFIRTHQEKEALPLLEQLQKNEDDPMSNQASRLLDTIRH